MPIPEKKERNKEIAKMYRPGVKGRGLKALGKIFELDHMVIRRILVRYGKIGDFKKVAKTVDN